MIKKFNAAIRKKNYKKIVLTELHKQQLTKAYATNTYADFKI